jgi:hypothetical protein
MKTAGLLVVRLDKWALLLQVSGIIRMFER